MDEPLYCVVCGREECEHPLDAEGPYCHTCGVIPRPGGECVFYRQDGTGNATGCVPRDPPPFDPVAAFYEDALKAQSEK